MMILKNILFTILAIALNSFMRSSIFEEEGLILMISSEKTIYKQSDQILIEAKIVNLSEGSITFVMPPLERYISYVYKTFQGEIKGGGDGIDESTNPRDEKLITLEKNELIGEVINLSKLFDSFEEPGIYNIQIKYRLGDSIRPSAPIYIDSKILVRTRYLGSNYIKIKIENLKSKCNKECPANIDKNDNYMD